MRQALQQRYITVAHNIPIPVKPYSTLQNTDGVPVSELVDLLGGLESSLLADRTISAIANLATASRIAGQAIDVTRHDFVEVEIVSSSDVLLGKWQVSIDDWRMLTAAADTDTISVAGGTAYDVGTVLIGRTNTDRVLVQADTFTTAETNFVVNIYGLGRDAGLLGRRLSGSGTNHSKPYLALTRANSAPSLPSAAEFSYNGVTLTHTPDGANPTFTDPNVLLSGTGTIYAVSLQLIYDHYTSTWSVDIGSLITQGTTSDLAFAADEDATTWSGTPITNDDQWARIRDENGNYVYIRTRTAEPATGNVPTGWRPVEICRFAGAAGTNTGLATPNFDWSDYTFLEVVYLQYDSTGTLIRLHHELFPAFRTVTVAASGSLADEQQSLQCWFSNRGSGIYKGRTHARSLADIDGQCIRINFINTAAGGVAGSYAADGATALVGFSDNQWLCVVRAM